MPHHTGTRRGSDRGRLGTDRHPDQQARGFRAQMLPKRSAVRHKVTVLTGLARSRQKLHVDATTQQLVANRTEVAADRQTRNDQHAGHPAMVPHPHAVHAVYSSGKAVSEAPAGCATAIAA